MSCGGTSERPKTAEELKVELEMQEKFSPHDYLSLDNLSMKTKSKKTKRGGLFRDAEYSPDGVALKGVIKNSATIADYKDVVVNVVYLSKTESVIKEAQYTIFEYFKHGTSTPFSINTRAEDSPSSFESFNVTIVNASVVH